MIINLDIPDAIISDFCAFNEFDPKADLKTQSDFVIKSLLSLLFDQARSYQVTNVVNAAEATVIAARAAKIQEFEDQYQIQDSAIVAKV